MTNKTKLTTHLKNVRVVLALDEGVVVLVGFLLHKHLRINDPEMLTKEI